MNNFVKAIVTLSLKNRFFVLIFGLIIVIVGVISYLNTPVEAFPDLTNTRIQIITQWPGRSAQEVERFITIPLEVELNSTPKKTHIRTISLFGLSVVNVIFEDDVEDFEARQNVANRIINVDLPDNVTAGIQPPYGPTGEIYRYTLESKKHDQRELKTIQDWVIERQIKSVPGIADVVSFGGEVKTYEVIVDPQALLKYDISALDVFDALSKSNVNVGGDVIVKHDQAYVVRGLGLLTDISDIENIIVANNEGTPLLIKNIAKVKESCLPKLGYIGRDTSTQGLVEGIVLLRKGENPSKVLVDLREKIKELNESGLPDDVKINTFYDRGILINHTIETVTHNIFMGVLLVTLVIFLFLGDWRATIIAALIIPFALLFAFICLRIKGMSANLLSMGAIDFGIIIDGTVVMIEGLFIVMDHRANVMGMERFNKASKLGLIKSTAGNLAKPIFFAKLIIITALLPIFSFQHVEGKMFSPLAWTLGFALVGATIATLTIVPVMFSFLFNKNVKEKHTFLATAVYKTVRKSLSWCFKNTKFAYAMGGTVFVISLYVFTILGSEFLPHLNEGAIYIRASMPYSTSLEQSIDVTNKLRAIMHSFPEIKGVVSQTGRPNDGTDATGFFNIEFHAELKPKEEWGRNISKEELIDEMKAKLGAFEGINFNFSQPIMDNVEEAVSGVKGSLAVKIYGYDPDALEAAAKVAYDQLKNVKGVDDLGIIKLVGQPELRIDLDQAKMAAFGVNTKDADAVIEMAIGGKAATQLYEDERKFDIRVRYAPEFRQTTEAIGNLMVPTTNGSKVPLKLIADIESKTGMAFLYRENNKRFIAVKFSVRGRDLGSTIAESQKKVAEALHLNKGMKIEWQGEYENQVRATDRLKLVVPISLVLIFFLLYIAFGTGRDAGLIFLNVPFSLMGGILALQITNTNFSISAGIGFIALFGVAVQSGVILISIFKDNLDRKMLLHDAVFEGTLLRVRPVFMTAMMAILGLLPAALSSGIGSETQKPLAIVVIGGLITDTILSLHIFPLIVEFVYRKFSKIK